MEVSLHGPRLRPPGSPAWLKAQHLLVWRARALYACNCMSESQQLSCSLCSTGTVLQHEPQLIMGRLPATVLHCLLSP